MRPIDADALLALYASAGTLNIDACKVPVPIVRKNIIGAPTLDYAPVRHGEWIPWIEEVEIYNTGGFREPKQVGWLCSECKKGRCEFQRKHCPDCGARMDGGKNDA